MNVNQFIDGFRGGARTNLFEVWIQYPPNLLPIISTEVVKSTAAASIPANAELPENIKQDGAAKDWLQNTVGAGSRLVVKEAKLPSSKRTTVEFSYKGRKFPYPGTVEDETSMSLTLYNDIHFFHRNALEIWAQNIRSTQTNIGRYPKELFGEVRIYQHDQLGNVLKVIKLINAFPTEVGEIGLNWDNEELETFSTNFSYMYFLTDTSDSI